VRYSEIVLNDEVEGICKEVSVVYYLIILSGIVREIMTHPGHYFREGFEPCTSRKHYKYSATEEQNKTKLQRNV
jgi:hypothetical protein